MEELFRKVWEAAQVAGPFGTLLMCYVWLRTDSERRLLQKKYDKQAEDTITALNGVREALRDINMLLSGRRKPHG